MEINTKENIRTVTSNSFITANGLDGISLKARKLFYVAISQCRKNDNNFYEYSIKASEFANLLDISPTHVYEQSEKIAKELMKSYISYKPEGKKRFKMYSLFSKCEYTENSELKFKLNQDMTDFLLQIKSDFSQPLLSDFVKMNSPYSMAIWHLMQREMHSKKPNLTEVLSFTLSLEEMREVTGSQNKLKKLSQFKERILDKAIREISDNCGVDISYTYLKKGKEVIGFNFSAKNQVYIDELAITQETKDKVNLFELKQKSKSRKLTSAEQKEYERLVVHAEQMEFA